MKKTTEWILNTVYIIILIFLSLVIFWELYAKTYVENYIDNEYGHQIKETYNNTELIKQFDIPVKDDKGES